jgi:DNA polymerase III subunit epsilon
MKTIVFDTETTGLPLQRNSSIYKTEEWPHMVQLSYMVVDENTHEIITEVNDYINIDDDVVITEKSFDVHGLTHEFLKKNGISVQDALHKFNTHAKDCTIAVGHNVSFDKRMVMVEGIRNKIRINMKDTFCTMKNSTELCAIKQTSKDGSTYFKYPNLSELHYHLFTHNVKNLHDASVDILICMRCYYKMIHDVDIVEKNSHVKQFLSTITI